MTLGGLALTFAAAESIGVRQQSSDRMEAIEFCEKTHGRELHNERGTPSYPLAAYRASREDAGSSQRFHVVGKPDRFQAAHHLRPLVRESFQFDVGMIDPQADQVLMKIHTVPDVSADDLTVKCPMFGTRRQRQLFLRGFVHPND